MKIEFVTTDKQTSYWVNADKGYIFDDDAIQSLLDVKAICPRFSEDKRVIIWEGEYSEIELAGIELDLYHLQVKTRGRPFLDPGLKRVNAGVRIPKHKLDSLEKITGLTPTKSIELVIDDYIKNNRENNE